MDSKPLKILLLSTNIDTGFPAVFPMATSSLSAFLKPHGYDVKLMHLEYKKELKKIPQLLKTYCPDVVGVTAMSCQLFYMQKLADMAKSDTEKKNSLVECLSEEMRENSPDL